MPESLGIFAQQQACSGCKSGFRSIKSVLPGASERLLRRWVPFEPPAKFTSFKVSFDASVERAVGHVGSFGCLLQPACKTKLNSMAPLTLFCRYTSIRVIMNHA